MRSTLIIGITVIMVGLLTSPLVLGGKPVKETPEEEPFLGDELVLKDGKQLALTFEQYVRLYDWDNTKDEWVHVWSAECGTNAVSVIIGDVDSDGYDELVVAYINSVEISKKISMNYYYICIWEDGSTEPTFKQEGRAEKKMQIGDVDEDNKNELVMLSGGSYLFIYSFDLDSSGNYCDSYNAYMYPDQLGWTSLDVADSDNDGYDEILVGSDASTGKLAIINWGDNGYEKFLLNEITVETSVGDIDNDGYNEIFVSENHQPWAYVYEYDEDVETYVKKWGGCAELNPPEDGPNLYFHSTTISDLDDDGINEVVSVGLAGYIREKKNIVWYSKIYVWVYNSDTDDWSVNSALYAVQGGGGDFDRMISGYPDTDGRGRVICEGNTIYGTTTSNGDLIGAYGSQQLESGPKSRFSMG